MAKAAAKKNQSSGLLLFHRAPELQVLLAHPGGPYFAKKDHGAWSIPKGLISEEDADKLEAAKREFCEETGYLLSGDEEFLGLGEIKLKSGKQVHAWAFEGYWEPGRRPESNEFEIEWPPKSGQRKTFAEIDRAEMFSLNAAREKLNPRQVPFLDRLWDLL